MSTAAACNSRFSRRRSERMFACTAMAIREASRNAEKESASSQRRKKGRGSVLSASLMGARGRTMSAWSFSSKPAGALAWGALRKMVSMFSLIGWCSRGSQFGFARLRAQEVQGLAQTVFESAGWDDQDFRSFFDREALIIVQMHRILAFLVELLDSRVK